MIVSTHLQKQLHVFGFLLAAAWVTGAASTPSTRLAGIFGDNMVLQQGGVTPVWGWGQPELEVEVSIAGQRVRAKTGPDGKWVAQLKDLPASRVPQTLTVRAGTVITCTNVLIGDLWLGSGQSNMEWPVREISEAPAVIAAASQPSIRLFTVPRLMKAQRIDDVRGQWTVCAPETVRDFSAVLYLFGREIQAQTDLPLGLINSSVGGTRIELWTAPEGFAATPEFSHYATSIRQVAEGYRAALPAKLNEVEAWLLGARAALKEGKPVPLTPDWPDHPHPEGGASILYDGMIHPIVPLALRGVIWYQGEWNGGENDVYLRRMEALVDGWRKVWERPELPFYYVQLARMPLKDNPPWQGDPLAQTRDAQRRFMTKPGTGMACIIDLEGNSDWHPRNKQDVSRRLALWALHNQYDQPALVPSGPLFKSMSVEGARIRIRFDYVGSGLMIGSKNGLAPVQPSTGEPLRNFAIAGVDRKWVPAQAVIDGTDVVVYSSEAAEPVAVRYAFCQDPAGCNLYNRQGLPAVPFRTDSW